MRRPTGRWIGIGIAVLVVGLLALIAAGSGSHAAPALDPAGASTPATVAVQPGSALSAGTIAGLIVKIGIVAALLGGSLWVLRRYAGTASRTGGRTGIVSIVDTIPVAQGRAIYIVDVGDRALIVGATPQHFNLLTELRDAETIDRLRAARERTPASLAGLSSRVGTAVQGFMAARAALAAGRAEHHAAPAEHTRNAALAAPPAIASFPGALGAGDGLINGPDSDGGADEWEWAAGVVARPDRASHGPAGEQNPAQPGAERIRALTDRLRAARAQP